MTDTESKEVELKPDDVIAFAVSIYESQGYPKNSFEMLDRELSRKFVLQAEHLIKCGYVKFGKDNSGMVPLDKKSWDEAVIVLESEMLRIIRSKHPASGQLFNHPEDVVSWTAKLLYKRFSQQPPKERKVSLEEIKIIKSVLDYYNLTEDGFYTDIISEEIAKRLNSVLDGKEGG